jgi:hypothetical protein
VLTDAAGVAANLVPDTTDQWRLSHALARRLLGQVSAHIRPFDARRYSADMNMNDLDRSTDRRGWSPVSRISNRVRVLLTACVVAVATLTGGVLPGVAQGLWSLEEFARWKLQSELAWADTAAVYKQAWQPDRCPWFTKRWHTSPTGDRTMMPDLPAPPCP